MTLPDYDQERARLAGVYSAMSDEELAMIAESGDELSVPAQDALLGEATKRGLELVIVPPPAEETVEFNNLITVRQFRDLPEALLAKGSLDSAGIQTYLADDNLVRMDWFYSNLVGGIKLKVRAEDAEAANEILNQPIPESVDVEGIGEYAQPKCPRCQSLDVTFQELNKLISYGSAFAGFPLPVTNRAWSCRECGHQWEEASSAPHEQDAQP